MTTNKSIFRKSCIDRISSPEQLNDYIKVSKPAVWLILIAVTMLLVGGVVWGVLGKLETKVTTVSIVKDGVAICYVTEEQAEKINTGMEVRIENSIGKIITVAQNLVEITDDFDNYALYIGNLQSENWVFPVTVEIPISDGIYKADIITESLKPISFIFN